jgi:hypothetical protein
MPAVSDESGMRTASNGKSFRVILAFGGSGITPTGDAWAMHSVFAGEINARFDFRALARTLH